MDFLQDQELIKIAVVMLALLAAWWAFRVVLGWAKRLSRLGCMAILTLAVVFAVVSRLA